MPYYFVISDALFAKLDGRTGPFSQFACRLTTDGRRACAVGTVSEYPESFAGHRPLVVELEPADFAPLAVPEGLPGYTAST
ncbi:hypothetical protein [Hymenobacter sediminicola]|uniref:Uncharacterized protein n=1 Tax=Hymenobacter sediminicola TaxID=2761579 RepID=A0A7G7W316_9BACT|nr:hypothetical protein [Hymenobacter sediminicola]QNH60759.1 hypothetical protein H4317_11210 [Hymenobacter sediminicola]